MYSDTEKEKIYRLETLGMREKDFHKEILSLVELC